MLILELIDFKLTKKELYSTIVCFALFVLTVAFVKGAQNVLPASFLIIYSARNVCFNKICKVTYIITFFLLAFVIASSFVGIINDYVFYSENRIRHYLGFRYALYPSTLFFNATTVYLFAKGQKVNNIVLLSLCLFDYFLYVMTNSRATAILTLVAIVVSVMVKLRPKLVLDHSRVYSVLSFGYILYATLSLFLTLQYTPSVKWMKALNSLLGNRLSLGKKSLDLYGVSLLGQNIKWVGNGLDAYGKRANGTYLCADSLYINLPQHYGLIFSVVLLVLVIITMRKVYKSGQYYLLFFLTLIGVHCIIDDLQIYLHYNTFLLVIGYFITNKNIRLEIDDIYRTNSVIRFRNLEKGKI